MAGHRITDFVDQSALDGLRRLKEEMDSVKETYTAVASELVKGLKVNVEGMEQLEKLSRDMTQLQQQAAQATQRHSAAVNEQGRIIANTTNTISRQLMEQEKVNEATRDAYTRQREVKEALTQAVSSYSDMTKRLAELTVRQDELNKQKKEEKRAYEEGQSTYQQYTATLQQIIAEEQALAAEKAQLSSYTRSEAKENQNSSSSYNAMSQELARLKKAYRELDQETRESEVGQGMLDEIKELGAHLKDLDASMGDFQRNVGDYAIAGASVKKELKELVMEIATLTVAYRGMSDEEKASAEGQELEAKIQSLTEQAGVLRDAVSDTNKAISSAASDTRAFDQISEGIGLMIDGFGLATGAAQMLGLSEEDLVEVQTKLQAAIAASNAIKSIQNTLQKESALMQGVALIQTKAHTLAIAVKTAAEGKGIIVTNLATVAQAAFNAVAKANPYVLLASVILGVVAAVAGLVSANKKAKQSEEEMQAASEQRRRLLEQQREAQQKFTQTVASTASSQIASLMQLRRQWKELGNDMAAQKKFIEINRDKFKELGLSVDSVTTAERILDRNTDTVIAIIMKRARAAAYAQAMTAAWSEAITNIDNARNAKFVPAKAGSDIHTLTEKERNKLDVTPGAVRNGRLTEIGASQTTQDRIATAVAASQAKQKEILDKANRKTEEYAEKISSLTGEVGTLTKSLGAASSSESSGSGGSSSRGGGSSRGGDSQKEAKSYEELRDYAVKCRKEAIDMNLALEQEGTDAWLELKKQSLTEDAVMQKNSVKKSSDAYLANLEESYSQGVLTKEQYDEMKADAEQNYADKVLAIEQAMQEGIEEAEQTARDKHMEAIEEQLAEQAEQADAALASRLNAIKGHYIEQLAAAGNNAEKRAEAEKQYEEETAKATEEYAMQKAQAAIDAMQEILDNEDLTDQDRLKLEEKLVKAKNELETAAADHMIAERQREAEADKKTTEERMANAQKWLRVASEALNAVNDLASAVFDAKIERIEAEQEANTEAGEAEQERISSLVEKKVITEEEGEARKRASAAKTAKKEEELEKKKQALKHKQAVWNKANSIIQAVIATSLGIMQTISTMGMPAAIPMIAVTAALGALNVATIAAQPIPKYAKGTKDHPGGAAIVGDAGRAEIVSYGGRMYLTPDKPTLIDIPKGAEVYPDADKMIQGNINLMSSLAMADKEFPAVVVNNDYTDLKREVVTLGMLIKRQTKAQQRSAYRAGYEQYKAIRDL